MRHPVSQGKGAFQVDTETKNSRFGTNSLYELLPIFSSSSYKRSSLSRGYRKLTRRVYTVPSPSWHWTAEWLGDQVRMAAPSSEFQHVRADLLFRCVCEKCYSCIEFFSGAVITWETASRSGTASTSSQLPRLRVSKRASQAGCCAYWSHGKRTCRYASEVLLLVNLLFTLQVDLSLGLRKGEIKKFRG